MIVTQEVPSDLSKAVANWENEGSATGRIESNKDAGRRIPPFVLPVIFFAAIAAGIARLFHDRWQQATARAGYSPWGDEPVQTELFASDVHKGPSRLGYCCK